MHKIVDFARDMLGVRLFPGQEIALSSFYESGFQNWLLLAGRRGGKSLLSDIIACYEACVSEFTGDLRENEERYILIVSVRIDNSSLHIKNITRLLQHNRSLARMIKRQVEDRLELSNGVTILSLPASARAGRGFTCSTLILDELAFFVDSAGNASADSIYSALQPTTATFGERGKIVITTSVNARVGIVYDLYDAAQSGDGDFYLTKVSSRDLNPRVSERAIESALVRDPESAQAEYFSEFRDPCESYLSTEAINAAVDHSREEAQRGDFEKLYVMAIDPATMKDRYAFAVMHKEKNLFILDYARAMRPPVDVNAAEALLFDLSVKFSPKVIRCDTAATTQRLKEKLPKLEYTPFTRPLKLAIYGALKENLNLGQLVLYDHKDLLDELKALQIRNGVDIAAPRSGKITHDDLTDCLALCVEALAGKYGKAQKVARSWNGFVGFPVGEPVRDEPGIIRMTNYWNGTGWQEDKPKGQENG